MEVGEIKHGVDLEARSNSARGAPHRATGLKLGLELLHSLLKPLLGGAPPGCRAVDHSVSDSRTLLTRSRRLCRGGLLPCVFTRFSSRRRDALHPCIFTRFPARLRFHSKKNVSKKYPKSKTAPKRPKRAQDGPERAPDCSKRIPEPKKSKWRAAEGSKFAP